ncbi:MAG: PDZ domain-containing protein [Candidatus Methylomirabilia bacterium]
MGEPDRAGQAPGSVGRCARPWLCWLTASLVGWAVLEAGAGVAFRGWPAESGGLRQAWARRNQAVGSRRVQRGWLGLVVQEVTPALASALGLPAGHGVLVVDVAADSPAAHAGLQRGDVIVRLSNKPVSRSGVFRNLVLRIAPGTSVHLTVVREGYEETVEAIMGKLPAPFEATVRLPEHPESLGMAISDLTPGLARRFDLPVTARGAVVTEVRRRGLAQAAGLRPGDLIQEVNRQPVRSARDFMRAVEQVQGADLLLSVDRGGTTGYFVIDRGG